MSLKLRTSYAWNSSCTRITLAQAKSDLAGFSAKISAQFGIPEAQVKVVISTVKQPADAFMVFQLGQMARQPTDRVLQVYQSGKGKHKELVPPVLRFVQRNPK